MTTTPTFGKPTIAAAASLPKPKPIATFIMGMKHASTQTECDPIFEAFLDYKNAYNELNVKMQELERDNEVICEKYEFLKFRQVHEPVTYKRQCEEYCEEARRLRRRNADLVDTLKTIIKEY